MNGYISNFNKIFAVCTVQWKPPKAFRGTHWRSSLWEAFSNQCQNECSALLGHLQRGYSCEREERGRGSWPAEAPRWEAWRHSAGWLHWLLPGMAQPQHNYSKYPGGQRSNQLCLKPHGADGTHFQSVLFPLTDFQVTCPYTAHRSFNLVSKRLRTVYDSIARSRKVILTSWLSPK